MQSLPTAYIPLDNQTLMVRAKQRARELRREAVPAFWRDVDVIVAQAARSLSHYLRSLARHRRGRGHGVDAEAI